LAFTPVAVLALTALRTFSKIRGAPHMKMGWVAPRPGTIWSRRPSTTDPKPICNWIIMTALPKTWLSGSQKYCSESGPMMPRASTAAPSYVQLLCTNSTPLGNPVVPEV
jgi:hypothetical protein